VEVSRETVDDAPPEGVPVDTEGVTGGVIGAAEDVGGAGAALDAGGAAVVLVIPPVGAEAAGVDVGARVGAAVAELLTFTLVGGAFTGIVWLMMTTVGAVMYTVLGAVFTMTVGIVFVSKTVAVVDTGTVSV
jgi:hypothetical protein